MMPILPLLSILYVHEKLKIAISAGNVYWHSTVCDESSERHVCGDGKTVIEKTQICDDVPDCPVNNNSFYLVAEDESLMCPGNFFVFFTIKNVMNLEYMNLEKFTG